MEAFLSNASGSSDNVENSHDDFNYGLLPAFSTSSLKSEIPERLLQHDASTLSPSYSERNVSATHNLLQQNACSPQEQPLQQDDPTQQEDVAFLRHEDTQHQPEDVSESSTALFQEQNHAETDPDVRKPSRKPYSWKEKLGTFAIVGLIAGSVLLCAAIGILAFLWFGSPAIPAWKEITARNWLSKAISIFIGVIQQVMMLQLGIVTATLASLALESRDVVIGDVASVSTMRATATSTGAFVMAWQYLSGGSHRNTRSSKNILLILSATLLWCLSQFLLLIILTDVSLRSTAGLTSRAALPYSLHYNETEESEVYTRFQDPSVGPWTRRISNYASFAEYSEPPYEAEGVSDTGVTLRAFLPFGTAQDRENMKSYKGKATVLDARVTCQVPQIQNATVGYDLRLRGSLAPTRNTPRLINLTSDRGIPRQYFSTYEVNPDGSRDFSCALAMKVGDKRSPHWRLLLCELWKGRGLDKDKGFGGLYSEFQDPSLMDLDYFQSSAYILLNNTFGDLNDLFGSNNVAEASQEKGEWLDLLYSNGSIILSASVCYAAFDFADLEVSMSSQDNRTESHLEPVFDRDTSTYTFQELRHAMGQDRSLPSDRRGILELAKTSWQKGPHGEYTGSVRHFALDLRRTADIAYPPRLTGLSNTTTGILSQIDICPSRDCVETEMMHVSKFLQY